jgi:N-acetylglucosaminyl-diphospho-decaprenol L-rhamnosyltransferase
VSPPTITAVIVSYADPDAAVGALESLWRQTLPPTETLLVDNDLAARAAHALEERETPASLRVLTPAGNIGYVRAANRAAREARGEWLFFMNPDAVAARDCLERLLEGVDGADVAVLGAQVLLPDGRTNAGENPVNIAGVSWSGRYGRPREHGPARDTAAVSGAALLARRETFLALGGLCPHFFMYVDDTDLAWRVRLAGGRVRYCPEALVTHDFVFSKSPHKWFYLERNREWALLSNLRLRTLLLLAPVLAAAEAAVLIAGISQGWLGEKARAWISLLGKAPQLIRWRRSVQASRRVSDYEVLRRFCAGFETELLDARLPRWVNPALERYRSVVLALARALRA